jgi:hypothetical protein
MLTHAGSDRSALLMRFAPPCSGKEMNRPKTLTRARFRVIRANGKSEQHILILDPAELHSLKVNAFIELHRGDRLDDFFDLHNLTERTR